MPNVRWQRFRAYEDEDEEVTRTACRHEGPIRRRPTEIALRCCRSATCAERSASNTRFVRAAMIEESNLGQGGGLGAERR